jgi:hypothetical protein
MELPYCNGYYVLQDGEDHCIVFYQDALIYEGKFNGMGIPVTFAYGLRYCTMPELCCSITASIKWDYQKNQKWKRMGEDKPIEEQSSNAPFVCISLWETAVNAMAVNDRGEITAGNVVVSTLFDDSYDSAHDVPQLIVRDVLVDDSIYYQAVTDAMAIIDLGVAPTERICRVFAGSDKTFCGIVIVNNDGFITQVWITEVLDDLIDNVESIPYPI